jgi:hypothetical protein
LTLLPRAGKTDSINLGIEAHQSHKDNITELPQIDSPRAKSSPSRVSKIKHYWPYHPKIKQFLQPKKKLKRNTHPPTVALELPKAISPTFFFLNPAEDNNWKTIGLDHHLHLHEHIRSKCLQPPASLRRHH